MEQPARTVLIVDDDPQILRLVEKMLRARPFKILSARTPSEALEICQQEPVDLLISDISMPEMDGNKLVTKVRELRPETAVLLISGRYREVPAKTADKGRVEFLGKPFFPSDLLQAMKELLPDL
jgi:CheY-like chemotaxis protein